MNVECEKGEEGRISIHQSPCVSHYFFLFSFSLTSSFLHKLDSYLCVLHLTILYVCECNEEQGMQMLHPLFLPDKWMFK